MSKAILTVSIRDDGLVEIFSDRGRSMSEVIEMLREVIEGLEKDPVRRA